MFLNFEAEVGILETISINIQKEKKNSFNDYEVIRQKPKMCAFIFIYYLLAPD